MFYDLHIHTTASDGKCDYNEIIEMAIRRGLAGISVTDHDCMGAYPDVIFAGEARGIEVISGVEISVPLEEREVHILGYFVDYKNEPLMERLNAMRHARQNRILKILDKLAEQGVYLDHNDFIVNSENSAIGRFHIAKKLVQKGYVQNVNTAFRKWLEPGKPAYVEREKISLDEAITLIHNAGGVAILAHGAASGLKPEDVNEIIRAGIDGFEVYHPKHNKNARKFYLDLADKHKLLVTGGSDFHEVNFASAGIGSAEFDKLKNKISQ